MSRKIWVGAGAFVTFFVAMTVMNIVCYSLGLGSTFQLLTSLAAAGGVALWLYRRENLPFAPSRTTARLEVQHARAMQEAFRVFGATITPPRFFNEVISGLGAPIRAVVYWNRKSGGIQSAAVTITGKSLLDRRRLFEAMWESARLERMKRGYPLKTRTGDLNWPEVHPQGFLIEQTDNDDGSKSYIIANGIKGSISQVEWQNAHNNGFGNTLGAWDEAPISKAAVRTDAGRTMQMESNEVPLFDLRMIEIVQKAGPAQGVAGQGVGVDLPSDLPRA